MRKVKHRTDFRHSLFYRPFRLAISEVSMLTNSTILILLAGIKIAAIMGDSFACTAKDIPTIL